MTDDIDTAVSRLSALAHPTRLKAFRLLIEAGPAGLRAGQLSDALAVAPNTMSAHFTVLSRAHLVRMERRGRTNVYSVNLETTGNLMNYLLSDCCDGHPEICAQLGDALRTKRPHSIAS